MNINLTSLAMQAASGLTDGELLHLTTQLARVQSALQFELHRRHKPPSWMADEPTTNEDECSDVLSELLLPDSVGMVMVQRTPPDPYSSDADDRVAVCQLCGDVEGHRPACPVPELERWLEHHNKRPEVNRAR